MYDKNDFTQVDIYKLVSYNVSTNEKTVGFGRGTD